jgi:hypothetical protein
LQSVASLEPCCETEEFGQGVQPVRFVRPPPYVLAGQSTHVPAEGPEHPRRYLPSSHDSQRYAQAAEVFCIVRLLQVLFSHLTMPTVVGQK